MTNFVRLRAGAALLFAVMCFSHSPLPAAAFAPLPGFEEQATEKLLELAYQTVITERTAEHAIQWSALEAIAPDSDLAAVDRLLLAFEIMQEIYRREAGAINELRSNYARSRLNTLQALRSQLDDAFQAAEARIEAEDLAYHTVQLWCGAGCVVSLLLALYLEASGACRC